MGYSLGMNPDSAELGRRIRVERNRRDWTQRELADRAGLNQPAVSEIERGKAHTYDNLRRVADAFGVDLGWFARKGGTEAAAG